MYESSSPAGGTVGDAVAVSVNAQDSVCLISLSWMSPSHELFCSLLGSVLMWL